MSSVLVHITDDRWFESGSNVEPDEKMLCVVLHKYGDRTPGIYQFRKADWLHPQADYFLDVSEKWRLDSYECGDEWNPSFASFGIISKWKPLGLPPEENQRLLKEIERWFDDNGDENNGQ